MSSTTAGRDVVDVLTADHRDIVSLIERIEAGGDVEAQRDLRDQLVAELVRHSVAEEMHVYPVMEEHLPDGEEAVEHDKQEHNEVERVLKGMEGTEPDDPRFAALVGRLRALLDDHIRDEESEQFPELRANVPRERLVELAAQVEDAMRKAPTRPHPNSPNEALFHKLAGPGVGLVDRLRDRITGRDV